MKKLFGDLLNLNNEWVYSAPICLAYSSWILITSRSYSNASLLLVLMCSMFISNVGHTCNQGSSKWGLISVWIKIGKNSQAWEQYLKKKNDRESRTTFGVLLQQLSYFTSIPPLMLKDSYSLEIVCITRNTSKNCRSTGFNSSHFREPDGFILYKTHLLVLHRQYFFNFRLIPFISGTRFPLKCVRHGNITEVASRQEIADLAHAGCANPCDAPLPCGHTCKIMCHGEDQDHIGTFKCRERCMK